MSVTLNDMLTNIYPALHASVEADLVFWTKAEMEMPGDYEN